MKKRDNTNVLKTHKLYAHASEKLFVYL